MQHTCNTRRRRLLFLTNGSLGLEIDVMHHMQASCIPRCVHYPISSRPNSSTENRHHSVQSMSAFGGKADMTGCGCLLSRSLLGVSGHGLLRRICRLVPKRTLPTCKRPNGIVGF